MHTHRYGYLWPELCRPIAAVTWCPCLKRISRHLYGEALAPKRKALIEHGIKGFLADSVEDAVAAIGRVETLGRAQVRETIVRRFSVERKADAYLQLYAGIGSGG